MNLDGPWAVRILWVTENGVCELIHIQWNSNSNSNSIQATEWYGQSDECECVRAVHAFASVCTNEKEIDSNTIKMKATTNRTMQQLKQTIFEKHAIRTNEMNGDHTYLCVLYVIFVGWWASELIYKACVKLHTIIREKKTMNTHHLAVVLQKERRKKRIVIIMKPGHSATFRDSRFVFQLLFWCLILLAHMKGNETTRIQVYAIWISNTKNKRIDRNSSKVEDTWFGNWFNIFAQKSSRDDIDLAHWLLLLLEKFPCIEIEIRT